MAKRIYWLDPRRRPSKSQYNALLQLYNNDVLMEWERPRCDNGEDQLARFIPLRANGLVYVSETKTEWIAYAIKCDLKFGVVTNHTLVRPDGTFGAKAICHWEGEKCRIVWGNPSAFNDAEGTTFDPPIECDLEEILEKPARA